MTTHMRHATGLHTDAQNRRARAAFEATAQFFSEPWRIQQREQEIAALPTKLWRGKSGTQPPKVVYRILCYGTTGEGPHFTWVAEWALWRLSDLTAYRCVTHATGFRDAPPFPDGRIEWP